MLGILYLALMFWTGDFICRRFVRFVSLPHRLAAAFLVGLLGSSWFTYLAARLFASSTRPLMWGNFFFIVVAGGAFVWARRKVMHSEREEKGQTAPVDDNSQPLPQEQLVLAAAAAGGVMASPQIRFASATLPSGHTVSSESVVEKPESQTAEDKSVSLIERSSRLDWALIAVYFVIATWLMFATLSSTGGKLQIAHNQFSDFGPNTAIMQSFAVGHNFPTQYPHFPGDRIRYHFLYYFAAGNLEFLGLDPSWSLNLLSIFSLVALLIMVMALGEVLFDSRPIGRIGSALFFFFGSLSYFSYLRQHGSIDAVIQAIRSQVGFLPSGFPYRGEDWGVWSLVVFLNQRHLAFSVAMLLFILVFLVTRFRAAASENSITTEPAAPSSESAESSTESAESSWLVPKKWKSLFFSYREFILYGIVLGLLPMWNMAVFAGAAAVLTLLFVLFPLRKQMLALGISAGLVALPQVIYLSTGSGRAASPKLFHWGYTLDNPTILNVVKYLGFTFGFKLLLIGLALYFATRLQRRFFL